MKNTWDIQIWATNHTLPSYWLTTPFSHMTDILSSKPLTPHGIFVKSSLPTAFWSIVKVQLSEPVAWNTLLKDESKIRDFDMFSHFFPSKSLFLKYQFDIFMSHGNWLYGNFKQVSQPKTHFIYILLKCRTLKKPVWLELAVISIYSTGFAQCATFLKRTHFADDQINK